MPSEISHIVYAQRFLKIHPEYEVAEFLSGTAFPDIRVLGVIERSRTHPKQATLEDVLAQSDSWKAGFLFHRHLDHRWDAWVRGFEVEPTYDVWRPFSNAVKLLGDELLYDELEMANDMAAWLWPVRAQELAFGLRPEDIKTWHGIVAGYLLAGPTHDALHKLLLAQHNPESWIKEVLGYLSYIEATPKWAHRIKEFSPGYE